MINDVSRGLGLVGKGDYMYIEHLLRHANDMYQLIGLVGEGNDMCEHWKSLIGLEIEGDGFEV